MRTCVTSAVSRTGVLPGGLGDRRRAGAWASRLDREDPERNDQYWQEHVNFIALAVNEENASGGRVVTAPTNGAAGFIPAVLFYALNHTAAGKGADDDSRNDIVGFCSPPRRWAASVRPTPPSPVPCQPPAPNLRSRTFMK
ncbi:L-serine ammonia-lyase, iron-sulfur-dependent, subunit beta [Streptomyces sp. NPDC021218]|uniref:L-serine ammonia-lyase, iron-sulfur-dependent, subunit beta n=1 Tax=Streptomyces sp. NPDC021218 TaxID=3365119 RepID=UPI0037B7B353